MGKPYSKELDSFSDTFRWTAGQQGLEPLRHFLRRWNGEHVVVVGSGGSYSAAAAISLFRELVHHGPTTPATPLEFIAMLGRLSPRALLLSAEGKNKDILSAARAAVSADLATGAVTLTGSNPLVDFSKRSGAIRTFPFQMDWVKDGYLATNSLLATVMLLYRALFGDSCFASNLGPLLDATRLAARRAHIASFDGVEDVRQRGLLLLHSIRAKTFALDLESKVTEAALTSIQVTDFRQFAHGRHLQLSMRSPAPYVVTAFARDDQALAEATTALLPEPGARFRFEIEGETPQDIAVAGLIDAMFFTEALARGAASDPGQPNVPQFGRAIHALDPSALLGSDSVTAIGVELAAQRKVGSGSHHATAPDDFVRRAAREYLDRLTEARLKAVVCDFDGTLCRAENRFDSMGGELVEQVSSLIRQGLVFAVATGRGDSLHTSLRASFAPDLHRSITVGYYSGASIARLDEPFEPPTPNPEFAELWNWLQTSLFRGFCKPLDRQVRGGQFSLRVPGPQHSARLRAVIRAWLDSTGRHSWRVFCSGHSVDVLDASTSKRHVVDHIVARLGINSSIEVLRLGDCGREDGNDFELLNDGWSLSCDSVSADLMSCWNFSPRGNNQAEATLTYLRALVPVDGAFRICERTLFAT